MRLKIFFLASASVFCASSLFASAQAASFDGRWDVVLATTVGKCDPAIRTGFVVKSGDIGADSSSALKADGVIQPGGSLWVRFAAGRDVYRGQGKLNASSGSGTWSSGSLYCGGKWTAKKLR